MWIEPSRENARRVMRALAAFGAPLEDVNPDRFHDAGRNVSGVAPGRIDVLTDLSGLSFAEALGDIEGL